MFSDNNQISSLVLIIDDDVDFSQMLSCHLKDLNINYLIVHNLNDAFNIIKNNEITTVFLDVHLGKDSGLNFISTIKKLNSDLPILMISGDCESDTIVKAIKMGASDYITKPINFEILFEKYEKLNEIYKLKYLENKLKNNLNGDETFIANSPYGTQLIHQIVRVAKSDSPVVITGESGTGKSEVARLIHKYSSRSPHPFVSVNCTTLPESQLDAELFGVSNHHKGKLVEANCGTLFLNEISDLNENLQAKILRVIQGQEFEIIGGNHAIKTNVRFVAATKKIMEELVNRNQFRDDLFYRLNVLSIHVPPLRDRKEDIPDLAHYFFKKLCEKMNKEIPPLSDEIISKLSMYHWPGNIREMQNVIERTVVLNQEKNLTFDDFVVSTPYLSSQNSNQKAPSYKSLKDLEYYSLMSALEKAGGNISTTAKYLGVGRDTVYRRLKKYNIGLR